MEEMIDQAALQMEEPVKVETKPGRPHKSDVAPARNDGDNLISCLRKEKVTVSYILNEKTGIQDRRHPYFGGLANGAFVSYTVPMLRNGSYKNPLTDSEKAFLEDYLGLEYNALSVHRKENNYWENFEVILTKEDTILNLEDAIDFIKYRVLLLNSDYIAPSQKALKNAPKETYRFVIKSDKETLSTTSENANYKTACWKAYLKVEDNSDVLRAIIRTLDGKVIDRKTPIGFIKDRINSLIDRDPKHFLSVITDECLPAKVVLMNAIDMRVVERRNDFYYFNGEPLCVAGENSTFEVAARFISQKRNQEIKFAIEAKLAQE